MGLSQYKERVASIPMLQGLDDRNAEVTCAVFLEISKEKTLVDGDTLFEKGSEDANTGALLVEGTVAVEAGGDRSIELEAPDILGEMQQFEPTAMRVATVKAIGPCTILEFSWHEFVNVVMELLPKERQLGLREAITEYVGNRLEQLVELDDPSSTKPKE